MSLFKDETTCSLSSPQSKESYLVSDVNDDRVERNKNGTKRMMIV